MRINTQPKGLSYIAYAGLLFESVTAFFSRGSLGSAKDAIIGFVPVMAFIYIITACGKKGVSNSEKSKAEVLLALYFFLAAASTAQLAISFFVAAQQQLRGTQVYVLLFLAVCFYGAYLGPQALARSALPTVVITVLLLFLSLLVACLPQMNLQNLSPTITLQGVAAHTKAYMLPPAFLMAYRYHNKPEKHEKKAVLLHLVLVQYLFLAFLALMCNLVLGDFAPATGQPILFLVKSGNFFGEIHFGTFCTAAILLCGVLEVAFLGYTGASIVQQQYPLIKNKNLYMTLIAFCAIIAIPMQALPICWRAVALLLLGALVQVLCASCGKKEVEALKK
ncbi:GerAB/ArcD/ProY family transporter [Ruminococcaceae bacterium OttesenSCG-928-N02]|nr:GerAB/ArcD/ProY family transporter [Ruminococcaceae bacterium OttesenSCG-928-N02]